MIVIAGTVRAPDAASIAAMKDAMASMLTETRKEDGCIRYAFAVDVLDPCLVHIAEAWRDRDALTAHFHSPHMAEWRKAVGEAGLTDRDLKMFETDEGTAI